MGRSYLKFEELQTLICEVEAVTNSHPLSYLHTDSSEPMPLTPAHFLTRQRITTLPSYLLGLHDSSSEKTTATQLNKRLQYRQRLSTNFWHRWKKEYLMELRSAHHVSNPTNQSKLFKVGVVVLTHEDKQPKHMWKMGRINQTFIGRDKIRSCAVRLPSGVVIKRPVQLLYPLEVDEH